MAKPAGRNAKARSPGRKGSSKRTARIKAARPRDESKWWPPNADVRVERDAAGRVTMLHHPAHPFRGRWNPDGNLRDLTALANRYLSEANKRIAHQKGPKERPQSAVPETWVGDLGVAQGGDGDRFTLQWLREPNDLRQTRATNASGETVALLAGLSLPKTWGGPAPLYGGQGVRVVIHVDPVTNGVNNVRIVGMTSTLPHWSDDAGAAKRAWYPDGGIAFDRKALEGLGDRIVAAFGLGAVAQARRAGKLKGARVTVAEGPAKSAVHGLSVPDAPSRESPKRGPRRANPAPGPFYGIAMTGPIGSGETFSHRLVTRFDPSQPGAEKTGGEPLYREPLIADIDTTALVFTQDPVSKNGAAERRRLLPSKSWTVLDSQRVQVDFRGLNAGAKAGTVKLEDPNGNFIVTWSRHVTADLPFSKDDPKEIAYPITARARSDEFAAANAYHHTSELFRRMATYGLDPATYFAFVQLPILVRYRAGIYPGSLDGRTINAQVWWTLAPGGGGASPKGTLEVRFALGDLMSSVELAPLGIAADPRWCWHEFSHVLLMAATGQREFAFAHSAGDALAAIVCDPGSKLALDHNGRASNDIDWRGVTFPWVDSSRRHDRKVTDGWSWTGALYRKELFFAPPDHCDKRGYWAEQLLSSSLFRLYRAVGGDTEKPDGTGKFVPDVDARTAASDYVVYLIMQAISIAGNAWVNTLKTPAQFVAALESADTAQPHAGLSISYALGTANKVIRWAFERQGLHGLPGKNTLVIGPESDMKVDLHIDDLRDKRLGPYTPVNFYDGD
jgi:hypothetical protein